MEDNNQQNRPEYDFFDELMFGPPSNTQSESRTQSQMEATTNQAQQTGPMQNINPEPTQQQQDPNPNQNPMQQYDLNQIMGQVDTFMNYAHKLGPAINQLAPILKMLQSFTDQNKK